MKKLILIVLFLIPALLFAQDLTPPSDWGDLYSNLEGFLATWLGIAGIAMFVGEFLVRWLKVTTRWLKVLLVWVAAIAFAFLGSLVNLGFLAEANWWTTLIWGVAAGIVANGMFSSNLAFLKTLVELVIGLLQPKEPKVPQ